MKNSLKNDKKTTTTLKPGSITNPNLQRKRRGKNPEKSFLQFNNKALK
jgi:hypothetical protein